MINRINEAVSFLQRLYPNRPSVAVVLGSGLGSFTAEMAIELEVSYSDIPHFPVSTVAGHSGKLIFGEIGGKKLVVMAGRFHFYEGYSAEDVVLPIRVMKFLGVQTLLISNAAGGMNPDFTVGDLMVIRDHISLFTVNPLLGKNMDELGPRFPDMSEPYKKDLVERVKAIAANQQTGLKEGVYCGVTGPTFETRAEYRLLRVVGGDAVGMSTVQEVIAAVHMGMDVCAISVITDLGIREEDNKITHEEVLAAAAAAEPKLTRLFKELICQM